MKDIYPVKSENIRWVGRRNSAILLDPGRGKYYKLNNTAKIVWQACNGLNAVERIAQMLFTRHKASKSKILKDVNAIISHLSKARLIKLHKNPEDFKNE